MADSISTELAETWKAIDGLSRYEVSSLGRVSRWIVSKNGYYLPTPERKFLKPTPNQNGYLRVFFAKRQGKTVCCYLHRLVAAAFLGQSPDDKPEVNHKDANKINCRADNLEYVNRIENNQHAARLRLFRNGKSHHKSFLTEDQVREIRRAHAAGGKSVAIAREFGCKAATIRAIVSRKNWKYLED